MTPEERAENVINSAKWLIREENGSVTFKGPLATSDVAAAIREATEAERQACKAIVNAELAKCTGEETGIGCLMKVSQAIDARDRA